MQITLTQNIHRIWPLLATPQVQATTVSHWTEVSCLPFCFSALAFPSTDTVTGSMHDLIKKTNSNYDTSLLKTPPKASPFTESSRSSHLAEVLTGLASRHLSLAHCVQPQMWASLLLLEQLEPMLASGPLVYCLCLSLPTTMKVPWRQRYCLFCS